MKKTFTLVTVLMLLISCNTNQKKTYATAGTDSTAARTDSSATTPGTADASAPQPSKGPIADAATILGRRQVPILCYHQIRDWTPKDSKMAKDYIIPVASFKEHIKILHDSGYHTILPDQLYAYLTRGAALPPKPVMLTFDDTDIDQYTIAAPEMEKYGYKGVFFIMTVSINRPPHYMSKDQIKDLSRRGHVIEAHTWDHHKFTQYKTPEDWTTQVEKPKKLIEDITGKQSLYFAYPYGLWNHENIAELKKRGIIAAFALSQKRDEQEPLYTIRRIIASGFWSGKTMYGAMLNSFK